MASKTSRYRKIDEKVAAQTGLLKYVLWWTHEKIKRKLQKYGVSLLNIETLDGVSFFVLYY